MDDRQAMADRALRDALGDVLGIDATRLASFADDTPLFGAVPEFDSMAVATLLTELEDRLSITIDDDEVDLDIFESFGALRRFVADKLTDG